MLHFNILFLAVPCHVCLFRNFLYKSVLALTYALWLFTSPLPHSFGNHVVGTGYRFFALEYICYFADVSTSGFEVISRGTRHLAVSNESRFENDIGSKHLLCCHLMSTLQQKKLREYILIYIIPQSWIYTIENISSITASLKKFCFQIIY